MKTSSSQIQAELLSALVVSARVTWLNFVRTEVYRLGSLPLDDGSEEDSTHPHSTVTTIGDNLTYCYSPSFDLVRCRLYGATNATLEFHCSDPDEFCDLNEWIPEYSLSDSAVDFLVNSIVWPTESN